MFRELSAIVGLESIGFEGVSSSDISVLKRVLYQQLVGEVAKDLSATGSIFRRLSYTFSGLGHQRRIISATLTFRLSSDCLGIGNLSMM